MSQFTGGCEFGSCSLRALRIFLFSWRVNVIRNPTSRGSDFLSVLTLAIVCCGAYFPYPVPEMKLETESARRAGRPASCLRAKDAGKFANAT